MRNYPGYKSFTAMPNVQRQAPGENRVCCHNYNHYYYKNFNKTIEAENFVSGL